MNKTCNKCYKRKPISDFWKDKSKTDGYSTICKKCYKKPHPREIKKNKLLVKGLKECLKCYEIKKLECFPKDKESKCGRKSPCKECIKKYQSNWYFEHRDEQRIKAKEYSKEYYIKNKKRIRNYYKNHNKKSKVKKRRSEQIKQRRKVDIKYKILCCLRTRLNTTVSKKYKSLSTMFLIGCEIDYLMYYLQEQFTKGMSWDNYGLHGWHIDHKRPCASFDLSKESEQIKCFHYTNLQPLWAIDNLRKGNKY